MSYVATAYVRGTRRAIFIGPKHQTYARARLDARALDLLGLTSGPTTFLQWWVEVFDGLDPVGRDPQLRADPGGHSPEAWPVSRW